MVNNKLLFMTIRELEDDIDPYTGLKLVDNTIRIYRTELDGVDHFRMHIRRRDTIYVKSIPYDIVAVKKRDIIRYLNFIFSSENGIEISMYVGDGDQIEHVSYLDKCAWFQQFENFENEVVGFLPCANTYLTTSRICHGLRILGSMKAVV